MDASQGYRLLLSAVKTTWENADAPAVADQHGQSASAMHATSLAGHPQNGTLTACGMSVTALAATMLARQQDHQEGDALTVMRRLQAALRCTHPRTGKAGMTPNTATREMAAHIPAMPGPAMTPTASPHTAVRPGPAMNSTPVTAGRLTTQMPGQA
jgi:hypothetical protein